MMYQDGPSQQASCCRLHEAKTCNFRNISATFQKRQKRVKLEVECSHQRSRTPGQLPRDSLSRMLMVRKKIKASWKQCPGHNDRSQRIPANRLLNDGRQPGMGNGGSADFIITRDRQLGSFVTRQLQNYKGKTQLKNDLQSHQAAKCVVISLFRGRKEPCDQSNRDKASRTGPESSENRESYRPINPKHSSYPPAGMCDTRYIHSERRHFRQTFRHSVPSRAETPTRPTGDAVASQATGGFEYTPRQQRPGLYIERLQRSSLGGLVSLVFGLGPGSRIQRPTTLYRIIACIRRLTAPPSGSGAYLP